MNDIILGVSDFVALVNQMLEYAYNSVVIVGELANFKVSKGKWVYFDLKDELASVRFFGTVYTLPGPLEDGMLLEVRGNPHLHPQFGFSVTVQSMRPVGVGSIKRAANLLEAELRTEGLFDDERKRPLPYPPQTIGLITSKESAAYADFVKILNVRWRGLDVQLIDVQVQGEAALSQILGAVEQFNQMATQPEVLVLIRGGGSVDDLQVFSTEQVARAVAASRIPTLVAIGHELDTSLAELASDQRASTPSNAAELLVPDRREMQRHLRERATTLTDFIESLLTERRAIHQEEIASAVRVIDDKLETVQAFVARQKQLATALSPATTLRRGYAIVRDQKGLAVRSGKQLTANANVTVQLFDATANAQIIKVEVKE
jgi:exodeoxyribonuclease VII large subunit